MSKIDREAADNLRAKAENHEKVLNNAAQAATALWRSRLDMAIALEDTEAINDVLGQGQELTWGDNNCQCGGTGSSALSA